MTKNWHHGSESVCAGPKEDEPREEPEPTQTISLSETIREPDIQNKPESDTKEEVNTAIPDSDSTVNKEEVK